jgi:hypothetical protein
MNRARGVLLRRGGGALGARRRAPLSSLPPDGGPPACGPDRVLPAPDYRTWLPDGAVRLRIQVS